jgi:hypothetical protein
MNEKAQLHTLEGFVAAAMMTFTAMLVAQSSLIITPQSELSMDVQLRQTASDALSVLDTAPGSALSRNLTVYVAGWNMTDAPFPPQMLQNHSLQAFDIEIKSILPDDVIYNVDFAYVENESLTVKHAIIHGAPVENSIVANRLVTLYNSTVTQAGGKWNISSSDVKVVEVRLIVWRV